MFFQRDKKRSCVSCDAQETNTGARIGFVSSTATLLVFCDDLRLGDQFFAVLRLAGDFRLAVLSGECAVSVRGALWFGLVAPVVQAVGCFRSCDCLPGSCRCVKHCGTDLESSGAGLTIFPNVPGIGDPAGRD